MLSAKFQRQEKYKNVAKSHFTISKHGYGGILLRGVPLFLFPDVEMRPRETPITPTRFGT
jgi:hypothetical protein